MYSVRNQYSRRLTTSLYHKSDVIKAMCAKYDVTIDKIAELIQKFFHQYHNNQINI